MQSLSLPADTCIRTLDQIWPQLQTFIAGGETALEIDAAALQRPDTALAQMLAMAVLRAREAGKNLTIKGASPQLREQVRVLGLAFMLDE